MSFDNEAAERMAARYRGLISRFINREISAGEFESFYLALFKHDKDQVPSPQFEVLDRLFADVDDYVADPDLRKRVAELNDGKLLRTLDDAELRARAREAYRKLYEE
jgi:hypothetical protein